MNQIQVIIENNRQHGNVVSSRIIAQELNKRHADVLESLSKISTNGDFRSLIIESEYKDKKGELRKEYLLTKDGFILYMFNIQGYNDFKMAYIKRFNELEESLTKQVPTNFKEALLLAVQQQEEIERLEQVEKLQKQQLAIQAPKAIFADAVASSHTSILVGDLAKLLKQNGVEIGQNRLFEWLRENGYLIKSGNSKNSPTQRAMELGLFELKERTILNPDGSVRITKTTKVTGKGQQYFVNKFLGC